MRVLALAFALAAAAANAALSETEREIFQRVAARSEQAIELLERTVRINSGTLNTEGVREVGAIFRTELDALGFKTRWVEMPEAMKRGGHLVATREGSRGKRILLIGHLDTVFEKHSPAQAWERKGSKVRGQGVVDMKAATWRWSKPCARSMRSACWMTPRSPCSSWATRSAWDPP